MTPSSDIFVASADGFRSQNADRPPEHLVRELVQNALDEDGVTSLDVTVTYHGPRKGTTVVVKDDAPAGVKDMKMLFTLWLSDKEDSHTKRGRMGRGLKELVSVADYTVIRSCSQDALVFQRRKGGRWTRQTKPKLGRPETGTEVTAFVRGWGEKASRGIVAFLKRVRAPSNMTMTVNGEVVAPFQAAENYSLELDTVIYEVVDSERKARERKRACKVECFRPPAGEKAQVYEMGIPVEECDGPVSIDVGQRVILRERRDVLTEAYRRVLLAKVMSVRLPMLSDADLRDNAALTAAASSENLSWAFKERLLKVWTEGKPIAKTPQAFTAATGQHIECISARRLPESVRDLAKWYSTDVMNVLNARRSESCTIITPDAEQTRFIALWEWIAKGIGKPCTVVLRNGRPDALASFEPGERVLTVYVEMAGKRMMAKPLGAQALGVLIHECAHWRLPEGGDAHGASFHSNADDVGGAVAAFLLENAEQARVGAP